MSNTCPACGTANRPIARFCAKCATPLAPVEPAAGAVARAQAVDPGTGGRIACAACGKPNRSVARFCRSCGKGIDSAATAPVTPRLVQPAPRAAAPLHPPAPTPAEPAPARPRPFTTLLLLLLVLVAAVLWWQRGASTPLPEPASAPAGPALSDMPQPPASATTPEAPAVQPLHPRTTPTPGPAPAAAPQEPQGLPAAAEPAASTPSEAPAPQAEPAPPPASRLARPPRQTAERSPESVCAENSGGVPRSLCIGVQCFKSEFRRHPTCVRLENEVRERRQREIDQGLVGG